MTAPVKVYVGGIGGAPSNNFVMSLARLGSKYEIVGGSSSPTDLFLSKGVRGYLVPKANHPAYPGRLLEVLAREKPAVLHVQHDTEVLAVSGIRDDIHALGIKTFLPSHRTIEICIDKLLSYDAWRQAGLTVPATLPIRDMADLRRAFSELGEKIWLRASQGAAGAGSLPTTDLEFASKWIDIHQGWGTFTAAEVLTPDTVTWSSIWNEGELVVAQTRRRLSWHSGNRTLSGVTGMTGVGETCSSELVDQVSQQAIRAIDPQPHGIFSVDMAYDAKGVPNPTEINIGRFFTTHFFFSKAGLNMPEILCDLCVAGVRPHLARKINPLPDGLLWIRGMDTEPVLIRREDLAGLEKNGSLDLRGH